MRIVYALILELLRAAGIEPATSPPDLVAIEEHDVHLVAWMAVGAGGADLGDDEWELLDWPASCSCMVGSGFDD
jgi:hypothetical protein